MKRIIATLTVAAGLVSAGAVTALPAEAAPARSITRAEVAQHATTGDCWIIVGRSVYDVTSYLPRHPGGPGQISPLCGKPATAAFRGEHGGDRDAARALAGLRIGRLTR